MYKYIGWLGILFGLMVAPVQLIKIWKTGIVDGIALWTYIFLCLAMVCYLLEGIRIKSKVFITANSINLVVNIGILLAIIILG